MKTQRYCSLNVLIVLGLIFLALGAIMTFVMPLLIQNKITQQTNLANASATYEKWRTPNLPILLRVYIYNVTNPRAVVQGAKPVFEEIGPIVYHERRVKEVSEINDEEDTVRYQQSITYNYRPDLSAVSEDELVTFINMPLAGVSKIGLSSGFEAGVLRTAVHDYMELYPGEVTVFVTKKIRELLFDGYYDGLAEELAKFKGEEILPNNTFGLYYGKNGTLGPVYEIKSGVADPTRFGEILEVNGQREMAHWEDPYCSMINGTDGSIFPAFVTKTRIIRVFSEDTCRSIYMTFQKEVDYFGVQALRFHLPPDMMAAPEVNPGNQCFATNSGKRSGLMDIAPCKKGAPVYASAPHFLYGEQHEQDMSGLYPEQARDETYLDIEPNTGMLMAAMKRFQVNIELFRNKRLMGFQKVPNMIFPVLWGEEFFTVNEDRSEELIKKLFLPMAIIEIVQWTLFITGLFLILVRLGLLVLCRNKNDKAAEAKRSSSSADNLELHLHKS